MKIQKGMYTKEQFERAGDGLLVRAPAKINLSLLVDGKRPDGYHEIETIMAKVSFYDEVILEKGEKNGIQLICKGKYSVPSGQDNIVYKAAQRLLSQSDTQSNIKMTLLKNIPPGSGLGGASSDAASTITGLNKLLQLGIGREVMKNIAAELGSDVPFFLGGPLAVCRGRGEKIVNIGQKFDFLCLLILPNISVSTKRAYDVFKPDKAVFDTLRCQISGLLRKNRIDLISLMCANMLFAKSFSLYSEIVEIKREIEDLGFGPLCLSGSGSALFLLLQDYNEGDKIRKVITEKTGYSCVIFHNNRW